MSTEILRRTKILTSPKNSPFESGFLALPRSLMSSQKTDHFRREPFELLRAKDFNRPAYQLQLLLEFRPGVNDALQFFAHQKQILAQRVKNDPRFSWPVMTRFNYII